LTASFGLFESECKVRQDQRAPVVSPIWNIIVCLGAWTVIPPLLCSKGAVHIEHTEALRNLWAFRTFIACWGRSRWRRRPCVHFIKVFHLPLDVTIMAPRLPVSQVLQFTSAPMRTEAIFGVESSAFRMLVTFAGTL